MTTSTSPTSSGSSAEVTSSKSITCGSIISARAIATRCCWPPESWCGCWSRLVGEADPLEQQARPRLGLFARPLADPARGEREVVHHLQVRKEVELLEDHPDPLPDVGHVRALARDLLALEVDPARVERLEQVDAAQQRALAAAARPDHRQHLAARDVEIDRVEDEVVAEALADLFEPDDRLRPPAKRARGAVAPSALQPSQRNGSG